MPGLWNAHDRAMAHGPHGAHGPLDWYGQGTWRSGPLPEWRVPRWFTLWVPVVVAFAAQVPASFILAHLGGFTPQQTALSVSLALAGPLALIGARRFPGPVVAIVALLASADLFLHDHGGPPYLALAFAIGSAVVRGARVWAWIAIGVCWAGTVSIASVLGLRWEPGRIALTTLGILVVFGLGEAMRNRRERVKEFRRLAGERRQSAVQAERVRIARELHDVLAHSLSQINVQAGVGLHLMNSRPDKAADALASIKETSKTALDEVRSVLGVLRAEGADAGAPLVPEPGLDRLPALVSSVSTSTLKVSLDDTLVHADVPAPVQLALFRIVQESLTNIARHAEGARMASVSLSRDDGAYRVEVRDNGRAPKSPASEAGGRGLLGMRERAELLGGHLSAGPADGGGFVVSASIPVRMVRA